MICSKEGKKQKLQRKQYHEGYVYVATNQLYELHNVFKIGFATNVLKRMDSLSAQDVFRMYPVLIFKFKDNRKAERMLHNEYKMWRINPHREYFMLDKYVLQEMKEKYHDFLFADKEFISDEWLSVDLYDVEADVEAEAMWEYSLSYF